MSVILITHHNENIYDVTNADPIYIRKKVEFKSRHSDRLRELYKKCVKEHASMGVPEEVPPDPANFLRKRIGRPAYIDSCRIPPKEIKPPKTEAQKERNKIPTVAELKRQGKRERKSKNFIRHNIKLVLETKTKEPVPAVVIDRTGTKKPLSGGLEPVFIKAPQFGKSPHYLVRFIQAQNKKQYLEKDSAMVEKPKCRYITKEERYKLLRGLKHNWKETQKQYIGLPMLTDTIPKRNRKCKVETDLKILEKDIAFVEHHPYIWVYDEDSSQ